MDYLKPDRPRVEMRQELIDLIFQLLDENDAVEWENETAYGFLQALAALLNDADGCYRNIREPRDPKKDRAMKNDNLCVGARAALGEHICRLLLRPVGDIPGGLWSWWVYVDGNVHSRGPGSLRRDPVHWYASLLSGTHRLVVRSAPQSPNRRESNTLHFVVGRQTEILVDVSYSDEEMHLSLVEES